MFWSHGCRRVQCLTYAEFTFCCISRPCPMVSRSAPGPLTELQPGRRWWVLVEGVKLCVSTKHVVTQLPLQSRHLPLKESIYNIQKEVSKGAPAIIVWWLRGTALTYEIFCDQVSCSLQHYLLPLDPNMTAFCYSTLKQRIMSMLPIGIWSCGTAWVGSDVGAHVYAHTSR